MYPLSPNRISERDKDSFCIVLESKKILKRFCRDSRLHMLEILRIISILCIKCVSVGLRCFELRGLGECETEAVQCVL